MGKKKKSVPQRHNHTNKLNPGIVWTLFKIDVWEDYIFSLQYLLEKNSQGLLLTEQCFGQRQQSIKRKGCYGCMTSQQHCSEISLCFLSSLICTKMGT